MTQRTFLCSPPAFKRARSDGTTRVERKPVLVDLALQGGGSHGAFTWGVLDRLLEEPWLKIDGISGTSAGAMNAAVLVDGLAKGQGTQDRTRNLSAPRLARGSLQSFTARTAQRNSRTLDVELSPIYVAMDLMSQWCRPMT